MTLTLNLPNKPAVKNHTIFLVILRPEFNLQFRLFQIKMDFFFLWLVTFVLGFWIFKKQKDWQSLPPGPWGLPIVGYLPFLNRRQPHLSLTALTKQYGPIYGISMGSVYAVVLSDHKLIREAFAKDAFSGRAPLYLTHGIMQGNG